MGNQRRDGWETNSEVYTEAQIEAIANYCDIEVVSETATHLLAYCPFHNNTDSPAFALDKTKGLWTCFNPSCESYGNLETLLRRLKGLNPFEAARLVLKYKEATEQPLSARLAAIREKAPEFVEFPVAPVTRMTGDFWEYERPQQYMHSRGFEDSTLKHFEVGYSVKRDMIIVPMHSPDNLLLGFIGRGVEEKIFKNSDKLPKSKVPFNYNRAKATGETVIICESSFDAMRIHQAGYPNVIALLGGHLSYAHIELINRTFTTIIIMTDWDKYRFDKELCARDRKAGYHLCQGHNDGRALGWEIARAFPNKKIRWAAMDEDSEIVYPEGVKDASDMSDDQIRACLRGAVSHFVYSRWKCEQRQAEEAIKNRSLVVAS